MSLLALVFAAAVHAQSYPQLSFSYSALADANCPTEVSVAAVEEAQHRTKEFEAAWNVQAPGLMRALFELTGKGFARTEVAASLAVCLRAPSYSDPLVLNVSRHLRALVGGRARGVDAFVDLVFHELIHTWIVEHLPETTVLLREYASESRVVRNHLHLMALQVMVYRQAGRADLLTMIGELYPRMMEDVYPRAWQIVQAEGAEAFFAEL
jgi:hypothetical protein